MMVSGSNIFGDAYSNAEPIRPRIAMLAPSVDFNAGGVIKAIRGQTESLKASGLNVKIFGPSAVPNTKTSDDIAIIDTLGPSRFAVTPYLNRQLMKGHFNICHQHGLWLGTSLSLRSWRAQQRGATVISPHGMLDAWALENSRWKKKIAGLIFEKANLHAATCLHALNESELVSIREFGLQNPVAVIPNGTELPEISELENRSERSPKRRALLFLGRIHPKKGLIETLYAWNSVLKQRPELRRKWRLIIAGWDEGGHMADLMALSETLGIAQDVSFPGPVFGEEKKQLLEQSDAFILASRSEGLPIGILEAWSYRKPVFMTKECNLPEGFVHGAAVEITTDPECIASVLVNRLECENLHDVGKKGRKLVEDRFSWEPVGRELNRVYSWLLDDSEPMPETVVLK